MAVLGINLPNQDVPIGKQFNHKAMKSVMEYLSTYNMESQAVATDGTSNDITNTGTAAAWFCGQPVALAQCDPLDISACTAGTETAWAVTTAYVIGDVRKNSFDIRFMCIKAHTSRDGSDSDYINNEPGKSDNSELYWEQRDHNATNASGTVITDDYDQWFLITAIIDGTMQIWEAGDQALHTTGAECKIPQYDPKVYCPIALLHILAALDANTDFTVGTSDLAGTTVIDSYIQLTGPVFPHPDNWDKN